MRQRSSGDGFRALHLEVFVAKRRDRRDLLRTSRKLYRHVRPPTAQRGGAGPYLYLADEPGRRRVRPVSLHRLLGLKPGEDLWVEVAFYASAGKRRATLQKLWHDSRTPSLANEVERRIARGARSWFLLNGTLKPV